MSEFDIYAILDHAKNFSDLMDKKPLLGKTQINLFFENSTRTQASFELAGKRLGADILNMSVEHSSVKKGETLLDTAATLNAMKPDILVVRHGSSGACDLLSQKLACAVINAGDGIHEHPTQALLDAFTIRQALGGIARKIIVICGDILHSRVARSNILLLSALGARIRLVAPPPLMPPFIEKMGVEVFHTLIPALEGADIIMTLRIQKERMGLPVISSLGEYYHHYGIKQELLEKYAPKALIMHPGPVNRNIEIASDLVDDPKSLIHKQVENGVIIRGAILDLLIANINGTPQSFPQA